MSSRSRIWSPCCRLSSAPMSIVLFQEAPMRRADLDELLRVHEGIGLLMGLIVALPRKSERQERLLNELHAQHEKATALLARVAPVPPRPAPTAVPNAGVPR